MKERTQIAVKLIASHLLLPTGLVLASPFISRDAFLSLTITQTVLAIFQGKNLYKNRVIKR